MTPLEQKRAAFKKYLDHRELAKMQIPTILALESPLTTSAIWRQCPTLQKQAVEAAISQLKSEKQIKEIPFKGYALNTP